MHYLIYKITNNLNGRFYIGSHKTKNINDDYMGSGKYLLRAIEKYGKENFSKEILFVFSSAKEMYAKEAEIVNEDFLVSENTYNLRIGGFGGFDWINQDKQLLAERNRRISKQRDYQNTEYREKVSKKSKASRQNPSSRMAEASKRFAAAAAGAFKGKKHTTQTKEKISTANKGKIPWNKGIPRTQEEKANISKGVKTRNSLI